MPEAWRVVFSSSGDLVPESGAALNRGLQTHVWLEAARWRVVVDSLASVLVPSDCRICTRALDRLSTLPVCDLCLTLLVRAEDLACSLCGERLDYLTQEAAPVCGVCRRLAPRFDFAISFGAYDGALRKLVHLLKYERLRPAAQILGGKLAEAVDSCGVHEKPVLVVPVPLHRSKLRQRGFNQSELIARAALKRLPASRFELHYGNLRRVRATESQTGLTRHQRRQNVRGAFVAASPERLKDRSVLIVDDVYTTGTTLNECARIVRAAGARHVVVATVARVYRPTVQLLSGAASNQEESVAVLAGAAAG